ncbi:MAG: PASTA domain-containing protein [Thermoanaerobaculia bacterium]|nr:PASTA domain-containing protein [Thermoanaerobaculia bacterium]
MHKLLRALGCFSYLLLLAGAFGVIAYFTFNYFVRRGVTPAPELSGLSRADAEALLADQGLRFSLTEGEDRWDDRVPAGHVVLQKPRGGTLVKRGRSIEVVLSRGPQMIEVPAMVGTAGQAAQVTLAAAGLTLGRTLGIWSDAGPAGSVVAQVPLAGALVERSAPIDLFFSLGARATYVMPDLVNRDYEKVRQFFESRGFRLGRVSYESYAGLQAGKVLRQYPVAGHPLRTGDVISLDVSASDGPVSARAAPRAERPGAPTT